MERTPASMCIQSSHHNLRTVHSLDKTRRIITVYVIVGVVIARAIITL